MLTFRAWPDVRDPNLWRADGTSGYIFTITRAGGRFYVAAHPVGRNAIGPYAEAGPVVSIDDARAWCEAQEREQLC